MKVNVKVKAEVTAPVTCVSVEEGRRWSRKAVVQVGGKWEMGNGK